MININYSIHIMWFTIWFILCLQLCTKHTDINNNEEWQRLSFCKLLRIHNIGKGKKSIESKRNTYVLQRSMKFTKTVFFVPSRRTCGGLITVLRLSPASSGLFSRRMLNTLPRSCTQYWRKKIITNSARYYKNVIINRKPMKKRDDTSTNSM